MKYNKNRGTVLNLQYQHKGNESLPHTLLKLFATHLCKPKKCQAMNYDGSNKLRCTLSDYRDIGIRQFQFVVKTQFLLS